MSFFNKLLDDFGKNLTAALANLQMAVVAQPRKVEVDIKNYSAAMLRRYQRVDLDGLTPHKTKNIFKFFSDQSLLNKTLERNPRLSNCPRRCGTNYGGISKSSQRTCR